MWFVKRLAHSSSCGKLHAMTARILLPLFATLPLFAFEPPTADPFESLAAIPERERIPQGAGFSITQDGSLLVGGQPRYLPAVLWYGDTTWGVNQQGVDFGPLDWLYNKMPDYDAAQRLGIDAGGFYGSLGWMKRLYRPSANSESRNDKQYAITIENGLSMYVDITASEWSHGSMWHADNPLDPDRQADPPTCTKPGNEGKLCNHPECVKPNDHGRLCNDAWTIGHQHWVPYSIVHPQGRGVWKHMWEEVAKDALSMSYTDAGKTVPIHVRPWCYELFNEPVCWDEGPYAKKAFAEAMRAKYRDIGKLNAAWSASEAGGGKAFASFDDLADAYGANDNPTAYLVEYTKFMEECFASLLAEGADIIRKVDPDALATFQPCTIRTRGLDLYRCYAPLGAVCSHTGGRGIMEAHMLRGLADGKPIVDSEMYIGSSESSIRNAYLDQFQRGYNISYAFKWNRLQESGYNFLNLDNVRPEALLGIREAKRDALDVAEFFAPRERGVPREVAVLFSSSTERLSQCTGHMGYKLFDQTVVGIDYAHLCPDVIWEDQIAEGGERLGRYKVLVSAGVDAVRPGITKNIRAWVEKGGVLVLIGETMGLNEYGAPADDAFPGVQVGKPKESDTARIEVLGETLQAACYRDTRLDDSWVTLASIGEQPVLWRKAFGKGWVWFANAKLSGEAVGRLVALAGREVGVTPCFATKDALDGSDLSSIEVTPAKRDGMEAWIVCARTMGGRVIRFSREAELPGSENAVMLHVWNRPDPDAPEGAAAPMVGFRQPLLPDADGSYVLDLQPGDSVLLVRGPEDVLRKRYPESADTRWLAPLSAVDALASGKARLEAEKAKRIAARPAFTVDPNHIHPLDLRPFVNRRFVDKVAGDGRDGWTDQGVQQSLTDTPWGVVDCNGVPMEFIRYDQNGYRDCLVMKSTRLKDAPEGEMPYPEKVEGIRVDAKAGRLYSLHAIAWGILDKVETAFTYVVRYGDGTTVELPVRNYREVWDWGYLAFTPEMGECHCVKGWANGANKGLYLWQWTNPHPEKRIATIDIVSACGDQIPLIAAISAEDPEAPVVAVPDDGLVCKGGGKGVHASVTNGVWKVALDDTASSWVCAMCDLKTAVPYEKGKYVRLTFEMNRLPDAWGNYHDHATPQFRLNGRDAEGKLVFGDWRVAKHPDGSWFYRADNDPETWQTAHLWFSDGLAKDEFAKFISIALQFQSMPAEHSGLEFRNFRFEMAGE